MISIKYDDFYFYVVNADRLSVKNSNEQIIHRQILRNVAFDSDINEFRYINPLSAIEIRDNVIAVINNGTDMISIYDFNVASLMRWRMKIKLSFLRNLYVA